jgi:hypothetical protein
MRSRWTGKITGFPNSKTERCSWLSSSQLVGTLAPGWKLDDQHDDQRATLVAYNGAPDGCEMYIVTAHSAAVQSRGSGKSLRLDIGVLEEWRYSSVASRCG